MALGKHPGWSHTGHITADGSAGRFRFLRHAIIVSAVLLSGCEVLGLNTDRPSGPTQAAIPRGTADGALPMVVPVPPPDAEMASIEPPAQLIQPPTPRPRPNRPPAPKPREEASLTPPKDEAPSPPKVVIGELLGSDFNSILHVLRSPDSVNKDNLSVVWTYAPPGCTLRLFFYPDIKTTVFHLLKYDFRNSSGEALMSGDACMDSMLAAGLRGAAPQ